MGTTAGTLRRYQDGVDACLHRKVEGRGWRAHASRAGSSQRFITWDERRKATVVMCVSSHPLRQTKPKLVALKRRIALPEDGLKSLFFSGSTVLCGSGFWIGSPGVGVAVGAGVFACQAKRGEECHLRMRA